ncbi:glucans biosynthesis protein [Allorhodopirellula heiligendammensis]|uniref:Glucans biosynthesis protein n=1 Tax=Allorhodopirellula heiligendammensis TaxID=2714739 RepID=A0A5C6BZA1_9BACT|nr:glucans biosynthesis protein [Allorhodopirellula heiligendammensis]
MVRTPHGHLRRAMPVPTPHFAGIDALRAVAAVAVVLLHACVPYARPSMAGLSWSVHDTTSSAITVLFWAIELVIMPIFLVIAGFFAARSITARGGWSVTIDRLRRLGRPLLLAMVFLLPVEFYIWMLGWLADGVVSWRSVRRIKFEAGIDRNLWGLSHLWFLQYLMTYLVILAVVWPRLRSWSGRSIARYGLPCLFAAAVISLAMRPEVVWGFQHSFLPVLSKWIYSGAFFATGVLWFQLDPQLTRIAAGGQRLLGPGALLGVAAVSMGIWWLDAAGEPQAWLHGGWGDASMTEGIPTRLGGFPIGGVWMRSGLAFLTVTAAAVLTFAFIGVASTRIRPLGPLMSSLAAGSFLIYLLHHPVVSLVHIASKFGLPGISPLAKVTLATTLGVAAGWSVSWLAVRRRLETEERTDATRSIPFPRADEAGEQSTKAA